MFLKLKQKKTNHKTEDDSHNSARQDTAPEAPKCQITVRLLKLQFFPFSKQNMSFSKLPRTRCRADPKRARPGDG